MPRCRLLGLTGLLLFCLLGRGQEPPSLAVTRWLQAPDGFTGKWSELRGNVVVLEFWATWCSPCVEAIPHLNQLAEEFQNQNVIFLAVTDDDVDRLESFFTKHPMRAIIGIDPGHASWQAFAVPSIPHTVLIGKDGNLIGSTFPENITGDVLREALAGRKPILPPKEGVPSDLEWDDHSIVWEDGVRPDVYAIIKPIKTTTSGVRPRPGHITADGVPLQVLIQIAYQTDSYHVDWRVPSDNRQYRAAFRVPADHAERLRPYMRDTLADLFGVHARWEPQVRQCYLLRRIASKAPPQLFQGGQELVQMLRGHITLQRQPVSKLSELLTNSLSAVVINETGLEGRYDFDIPYQRGNAEVTRQALKKIGLEAIPARRPIQVLVVTNESESRTASKKP